MTHTITKKVLGVITTNQLPFDENLDKAVLHLKELKEMGYYIIDENTVDVLLVFAKPEQLQYCKRTSIYYEPLQGVNKKFIIINSNNYSKEYLFLISDRDHLLISKFWTKLCQQVNIILKLATARHQQTNGQVERTIRTIKQSMLAYNTYSQKNWVETLSTLEFSHNDSLSASTGYTPFYLTYNQHPFSSLNEVDTTPWTDHLKQARQALEKAHLQQAQQYNKNRKMSDIQINDLVLLEREGIIWGPDSQRDKKLLTPWLGPFKVTAREGENATLELPVDCHIHPTFSVSKLKKYHTNFGSTHLVWA
jgi:hypothetical protein